MKASVTGSLSSMILFSCLLSMTPLTLQAQLAEDKCKFLGNIIFGYTPSDFTTYWNQVTPENAGKWGSVESTRDNMQWNALDNAYNAAKANGLPFKQHTFVWGQQQPSWIGTLSAEEQLEEVEEWISSFCERYPDTDFIDVVNEPLHAIPNYAEALGGLGTTGWDWVVWSFEKARQYCPNAKLILNDYNIINNNGATDIYVSLINMLKERGLIDIVGEQGHFLETTENATITSNLNKLYATGVPIHISEYDVNLADDNAQRDKYSSQFPVLWSHPGVQGITLWGYKQGEIWREDAYLLRSNGTERPAMAWLKSYIPTDPGGAFCLPVTSVNENEDNGLQIFPNPSHDGNITIRSAGRKVEGQILNLHGTVMGDLRQDHGSEEFSIHLPKGVYVIRTTANGKTSAKKIIVY